MSVSWRRLGDVAVAALIALFAWLALLLNDSVQGLGDMAVGIRDTGTSIESSGRGTSQEIRRSVDEAADAIESVPFIGGDAGRRVRAAGERSARAVERETRSDGRRLVDAGRQGQSDASRTALLIGWLAFLMPTALLLLLWLTRRASVSAEPRWWLPPGARRGSLG
jgi:hypothetical protein